MSLRIRAEPSCASPRSQHKVQQHFGARRRFRCRKSAHRTMQTESVSGRKLPPLHKSSTSRAQVSFPLLGRETHSPSLQTTTAIIPHIPQVAQSTTPQHPTHLTVQPDLPTPREEPPIVRPDIEGLRFPPEVRSGTPRATTSHSASDTRVPIPNVPEPDTLSSDSADSLMAQLRQVNRRLDEVQKEFVKSKEALGESSKGGSPFAPEIQDKPIPSSF
ncbi:hypothetical protein B296_00015070 [Ensete ventricosum]|uniref:Uncharacterized protein n=1 Tax=Ensete ventricosum TaxID=4639 RepID=A0A427B704_ENSVE|nr:hypothetical protein B296_00015070 [Ensete ventricosum]